MFWHKDNFVLPLFSLHVSRWRTDILGVGKSTQDVSEQTVGETTRRQNDRLPLRSPFFVARLCSFSRVVRFLPVSPI